MQLSDLITKSPKDMSVEELEESLRKIKTLKLTRNEAKPRITESPEGTKIKFKSKQIKTNAAKQKEDLIRTLMTTLSPDEIKRLTGEIL